VAPVVAPVNAAGGSRSSTLPAPEAPAVQQVLGVATTIIPDSGTRLNTPGHQYAAVDGLGSGLDLTKLGFLLAWAVVNALAVLLIRRRRKSRAAANFTPSNLGTFRYTR
jgi:hypothetical protein